MAEAPAPAPAIPAQPPAETRIVATVDALLPGDQPKPAEAKPEGEKPPEPERTFTQKELDEIIEKRLSKERKKRDEIRQERDVLRKLALEPRDKPQPGQGPQTKPAEPGTEPRREEFTSYEEFIEARAEYKAERAVERRLKEREDAERARTERDNLDKEAKDFRKRMADSAKGIEDYDDVVSAITGDDPVANISGMALETCEAPGKMLYHLATHPEEAERIASLTVGNQAREVLKLEQKLAKPQPKPSKAPEPIEPIGGKATVGEEMPDPGKDPQGWITWRNRQIAAQRGKVRAS